MAAEPLDLTAFDYALKEIYPPIVLETKFFKNNPLLGMVNKKTTFPGRRAVIPVRYVNPQGRSATFSFAQSNQRAGAGIDFLVPRVRDYGLVTIDNETLEASMDDIGAFITARKSEIDGILDQTTRSLATALYGSGRGDVGVIGVGGIVGLVITLATLTDITNFEVGQVLVASATQTGALRAAGVNIMEITAIDYDAGTLTVDATITGLADGDFLFVQGDHVAATDRLKVTGLQGWVPSTAPTGGDSFFGVDRSVNPLRLAGVRHDGTAAAIEDEIVKFLNKVNRFGGVVDYAYCHPTQYSKLCIALGAKVQYVNPSAGGEANISWEGLKVNSLKGPVTILPDLNCPNAKVFALQMDAWTFQSIGPAPKIYNADGVSMLRVTTADQVEIRCRYYGNLWTDAPGVNGVMSVDVATD